MSKALAKPEVRAQLEKLGAVIVGDTPEQFQAFLKRDYERWENVVKAAAIKVDLNWEQVHTLLRVLEFRYKALNISL